MFSFQKKLIALALSTYLFPQICSASPPFPGIFPITVEAQTCDRYSLSPEVFGACVKHIYHYPGVTVVSGNQDVASLIASAPENQLILLDGSETPIHVRSLDLKNNQHLLGVMNEGARTVLRRPFNSRISYVINTRANDFTIEALSIRGTANPDLVRILDSSGFTITDNDFVPLTNYTQAVRVVCGESADGKLGVGSLRDNQFYLGSFGGVGTAGVCIDCRNSHLQIVLTNNQYRLGAEAWGIEIHVGGVKIKGDHFFQTERDVIARDEGIPVAIIFGLNDDYTGFEPAYFKEPARAFLNTEVTCSTFDGGKHQQLIPLSLSHHTASNSPEHNHIQVAFNEFNNVAKVLEDDDLGYAVFSENSVCNIWKNDNKQVDRCAGITTSGFLHFTDNVICGQVPEGFLPPDCAEARIAACDEPVTAGIAVP